MILYVLYWQQLILDGISGGFKNEIIAMDNDFLRHGGYTWLKQCRHQSIYPLVEHHRSY